MGKKKKELGFDSDGAKKVMRKRDYMADMSGQLALGLMANVVGQLTYFYTDKVGLAVGGNASSWYKDISYCMGRCMCKSF